MERSRGPTQRRGAIAGPNPGSLQALCGRPPMQRRSAIAGRDVGSPRLCGRPCLKRLVELLVLNGTATVKIQNPCPYDLDTAFESERSEHLAKLGSVDGATAVGVPLTEEIDHLPLVPGQVLA